MTTPANRGTRHGHATEAAIAAEDEALYLYFVITARTDAISAAGGGFEEALKRGSRIKELESKYLSAEEVRYKYGLSSDR